MKRRSLIDIKNAYPLSDGKGYSKKRPSEVLFFVLVILFLISSFLASRSANSQALINVGESVLPVKAFAGAFFTIGNLFLVFLVVHFDRVGLITSVVLMLIQFPGYIIGIVENKNYSSLPGMFGGILTIIAMILIHRSNKKIEESRNNEMDTLRKQQKFSQNLFEQTARALVNSIDAKDTYSHGHSLRVAEYSRMIAQNMGKDEEECYRIYYTALLHDVGKIGISDNIINKKGKLTKEEYDVIKEHPVMGFQILSSISEYPYLSIGAHYHHERYDGKGYPDGLTGKTIPEIARIISVADSYDAMSSNRSYRSAIPQHLIREEIVKGRGSQFDPEIADIMLKLIDEDKDYKMRELESNYA